MWSDTLLIVFISICTAFLGEGQSCGSHAPRIKISYSFELFRTGLTWVMVYRTEKYQKLKGEVEKQSKKCMDNI